MLAYCHVCSDRGRCLWLFHGVVANEIFHCRPVFYSWLLQLCSNYATIAPYSNLNHTHSTTVSLSLSLSGSVVLYTPMPVALRTTVASGHLLQECLWINGLSHSRSIQKRIQTAKVIGGHSVTVYTPWFELFIVSSLRGPELSRGPVTAHKTMEQHRTSR